MSRKPKFTMHKRQEALDRRDKGDLMIDIAQRDNVSTARADG